ncbi:MAG TPA: HAD family acid phosphatase, partial [Sphingomonas sp.]|nr:HAD family acid phosphatase [Sphingomonas sp.]
MGIAALLLAGCAAVQPQATTPAPAVASPKLAGMQYLYGSGEAAAVSRQAWNGLTAYVAAEMKAGERRGVVLAPGATLETPRFEDCVGKAPAAVFDVDETVLLNLGAEYDDLTGAPGRPFGPRWNAWEKSESPAVAPTPGAKAALDRLRSLGVTVIFNSNRSAANAAQTAATIDAAGLGPAEHGKTL